MSKIEGEIEEKVSETWCGQCEDCIWVEDKTKDNSPNRCRKHKEKMIKYCQEAISQAKSNTIKEMKHILGELCENRLDEDLEGYAEYIKAIGDVRNKLDELGEI